VLEKEKRFKSRKMRIYLLRKVREIIKDHKNKVIQKILSSISEEIIGG